MLTLLCVSQQPYEEKDRTLPSTLQLVNSGETTQEGIWSTVLSLTYLPLHHACGLAVWGTTRRCPLPQCGIWSPGLMEGLGSGPQSTSAFLGDLKVVV